MSDGQQNRTNKPPILTMGVQSLKLYGENINGATKSPMLSLKIKRNEPVLAVSTGVEGDKDYGKFEVAIDWPTLFQIFQHVDDAASNPEFPGAKIEFHQKRYMRAQGGQSQTPMLEGQIVVGRIAASGVVYIGVSTWDNDRPKCKYIFRPVIDARKKIQVFKGDGTPWGEGELSQAYAKGWVRMMSQIAVLMAQQEYVAPDYSQQNGGGGGQRQGGGGGSWGNRGGNGGGNGGGGYNQNRGGGNGGGGYQQNQQQSSGGSSGGWGDDDIPM